MRLILLLITSFLFISSNAQVVSIFDIDLSRYPIVNAKVNALDEDGNQIKDLTPSNLELTENGIGRTINSYSCPNEVQLENVSVAMSIDISGSMSATDFGEVPLELGKATARELCRLIEMPPSEFALQACGFRPRLIQDFTSNKSKINSALAPLQARGENDFSAHLLNDLTGLLNVAKNGKNKRVAVMYTDAWGSQLTKAELDECKQICSENDIQFFAVIYSRPEAEPNGLKKSLYELADHTGGVVYNGITSEEAALNISKQIQNTAQSVEPCTIEWESDIFCNAGDIEVDLKLEHYGKTAYTSYITPDNSVAFLEFDPSTVRFDNPNVGFPTNRVVTVTARNSDFIVRNIVSSNPAYTITPTKFSIRQDQSTQITITYQAVENGYTYTRFTFENDVCDQYYFASGGSKGIGPQTTSLQLLSPNGGETFVVGSDTIITWEGISPLDTVSIDYSFDEGSSWLNLTNEATGLKYHWENIPKPTSDNCLVRVRQSQEMDNEDPIISFSGHMLDVYSVAFSPDGKIVASGGWDKILRLWDITTGKLMSTLSDHTVAINSVAFSLDGSIVASASGDNKINLWDVSTGQLIRTLFNDSSGILDIDFSPDGNTIASGCYDGHVRVWNLGTGQLIHDLDGHSSRVTGVSFSPDGKLLASGSYLGNLKIWDVATGTEVLNLDNINPTIKCLDFNPDGNTVVVGGFGPEAKFWDISTGQNTKNLSANMSDFHSLSFNSDGTLLIATAGAGNTTIWNVATGKKIRDFYGSLFREWDAAFSPDGKKFATCGDDNLVKIWELDETLQFDESDSVFSIISPLAESSDINLGECFIGNKRDSVIEKFISNIGELDFSVESVSFRGADEQAFSLVAGFPEYNVPPNRSYHGEFRFEPIHSGIHNAEIVIITQSDTLIQNITGVGIEPTLDFYGGILDFGQVEIGDESIINDTVLLKNIGNQPIDITRTIQMAPDVEQFEILSGGGAFNLLPGEERMLTLRFKPKYGGRTSGRIGFEYDGFGSPATIELFGTGIGGLLIAPTDSAYAGDRYDLDIKLAKLKPDGLKELANSYSIDVTFNGTILVPLDKSLITSSENDTITLTIKENITESLEIVTIPMKVGLGKVEETVIKLSDFTLYDSNENNVDFELEYEYGLFKLLGICTEGGTRLIDANSQLGIESISPNPSSSILNLDLSLIESGITEISIYNSIGERVKTIFQKTLSTEDLNNENISIQTDIGNLPTGHYIILLETPTYKESIPLVISK